MERAVIHWDELPREVVESVPGGIQETTGNSNQCHSLVGKVVISQTLNSMISEILSLNDSVSL